MDPRRKAITRRRFGLGAMALAGATPSASRAAETAAWPALRDQVLALMSAHDIPGLGFGWVRFGRITRVEGFGLADREQGRRATADTVFHLASVSKVVTGAAAMQLCEQGRFRLDDPIAPHLDFPVVNPRHPAPITFRQLFTHTSSISDRNYDGFQVAGDPTIGLRDFLVGYLTPGGKWFTAEGSYGNAEPGARFGYSNVGTALVGYLVERIGAAPLAGQTRARIFQPLSMAPAAWRLADLPGVRPATPYAETGGKLSPIAPIGYPDWPAGLLRTSTRAMTRFVAAHACGGTFDGVRLLKRETLQAMTAFVTPPPLPRGSIQAQGLFWEELPAARPGIVSKFGGDDGAHTMVAFDPQGAHGVVILTNRSPTDALDRAMAKLAEAALA